MSTRAHFSTLSALTLVVGGCIHPRLVTDEGANLSAAAAVYDQVARERELPFDRDVPLVVKSSAELGEELDAYYEKNKEAFAIEDALYHRIGVLGPDSTLASTYTRFYVSFVGGVYDPAKGPGTMILVRDYAWWSKIQQDVIGMMTGRDWAYELFLAHELVHALQDQHFGLGEMLGDQAEAEDADRALARRALLESEAAAFGMAHFFGMDLRGRFERRAFFLYLRFNNLLNSPLLAALAGKTPSFFARRTFEQYELGLDRVERLLDEGGWDEVSRSYLRPAGDPLGPPASTEQLLHPEKIAGKRADPPIRIAPLATLPASIGATAVLRSNVFGAYDWRLYLDTFLDGDVARAAAEGWGGDRYELLETPDGPVLVWRTLWDTEADARQLVEAYTLLIEKKYPRRTTPLIVEPSLRAFVVAPSKEGDEGVRTTHVEVEAIRVEGRRVVIVEGAPTSSWRALLDEVSAHWELLPPPSPQIEEARVARSSALEASIAHAPDAGDPEISVVDRLVLPARTISLRSGAAVVVDSATNASFFLPDMELRWGVRPTLEWTLPLMFASRTRSMLGLTAPSVGLASMSFGAGGLRADLVGGLLHAVPLGDRVAVVAQGLTRLRASTGAPSAAELDVEGALALSMRPWDPVVITPGIRYAQQFVDVGAAAIGASTIRRADEWLVLGSALTRGLTPAPLVELQVLDMFHVYEASQLVLDPKTGAPRYHVHSAGVLLYF